MADTKQQQIKVVGVGFPRTGTASLQRALQILGFKCHHMQTHILEDPFPYRNGREWVRINDVTAGDRKQQMIKAYFQKRCPDLDATVDYPASVLPAEMLACYPDAKFVHSVRKSPEAWRKSFDATVAVAYTRWFYYSTLLMPSQFLVLQVLIRQMVATNAKRYPGVQVYETNSPEIYNRHNQYVKDVVPQSQLLEHESSQGFKPLCEFLGVPMPKDENGNEIPYPHVNDSASLRRWLIVKAWMGVGVWCFWIAVVYLGFKAYYR